MIRPFLEKLFYKTAAGKSARICEKNIYPYQTTLLKITSWECLSDFCISRCQLSLKVYYGLLTKRSLFSNSIVWSMFRRFSAFSLLTTHTQSMKCLTKCQLQSKNFIEKQAGFPGFARGRGLTKTFFSHMILIQVQDQPRKMSHRTYFIFYCPDFCIDKYQYSLVPIGRHFPINSHASRH